MTISEQDFDNATTELPTLTATTIVNPEHQTQPEQQLTSGKRFFIEGTHPLKINLLDLQNDRQKPIITYNFQQLLDLARELNRPDSELIFSLRTYAPNGRFQLFTSEHSQILAQDFPDQSFLILETEQDRDDDIRQTEALFILRFDAANQLWHKLNLKKGVTFSPSATPSSST